MRMRKLCLSLSVFVPMSVYVALEVEWIGPYMGVFDGSSLATLVELRIVSFCPWGKESG